MTAPIAPTVRELERALNSIGTVPIEPPLPRLDSIERRVMEAIVDDDNDAMAIAVPAALDVAGRHHRRARRRMLAAAAVLVVVVAAAVLAVDDADDALVIAAADGVELVTPDGGSLAGVSGIELEVGTRIEVSGFLLIDDERFGPGAYVVTDDGVEPVPGATSVTTTERAGSSTSTSPSVDRGVAPGSPGGVFGGTGPPSTASRDTASLPPSTVRPAVNDVPRTAPATTEPTSTETRPVSTVDVTVAPSVPPVSTTAVRTTAPVRTTSPARTTTTTTPTSMTTTPTTPSTKRTTDVPTTTAVRDSRLAPTAPTSTTSPTATTKPPARTTTTVAKDRDRVAGTTMPPRRDR